MNTRFLACLSCLIGATFAVAPARAAGPGLYVTLTGNGVAGAGAIEGFDASGNGVVVASGLDDPAGIAFDASNDLFFGNENGYELDKIPVGGGSRSVVTTATDHSRGLAFSTLGAFYAIDEDGIELVNANGTLTSVANPGGAGLGLALDAANNFYSTDAFQSTITRTPSTGGNGTTFATGLTEPAGLAFDGAGNLYVSTGNTIMKFGSAGGTGTVFASQGLDEPEGLAFDSAGNLYAANLGDGTIEEFDPNGNGSVFASGLGQPYFLAFGPAVVPEPSTWALLGMGSAGLCLMLRRRGRAS